MAMLEVSNLSISFGGLRAVDGFHLNIEKGDVYKRQDSGGGSTFRKNQTESAAPGRIR